jgi:4-diphosphocytidyl-2-C-methyl-D-erythritol kinase
MIKEKAYAKINLFLNVVSKRFDGYHDLEMVMASLDLHDILEFQLNDSPEILVLTDKTITEDPKENLVYKIASFLQEEFSIEKGATIFIKKNIPIAAGLAGGSADAAATFRGLNKLWKLNMSLEDMASLGLQFGSDIPFCIYNKLCIAKGRGEELAFLKTKLNMPVLVVNPNIPMSTKEVFGHVKDESLIHKKITDMTNAIYNKNYQLIEFSLHNSLEPIVFQMNQEILDVRNHLKNTGLSGVLMSGSGSSIFAISKDKRKLKYAYETIRDDYFKVLTKIR